MPASASKEATITMSSGGARSAMRGGLRGARGRVVVFAFAATGLHANVGHAEPAECALEPAMWPARAKPYFLIVVDSSSAMTASVTQGGAAVPNSCGYPTTRIGHAKCAVKNTIQAYGDQVSFGLAAFARGTTLACSASCGSDGNGSCIWLDYPGGGSPQAGCGPEPSSLPSSEDRRGAEILVPVRRDNFYAPPLDPPNIPDLLQWVDNNCSPSGGIPREVWATGGKPLNGALRDAYRYLSVGWTSPNGNRSFPSPLADAGERPCRPLRVILLTAGTEGCDDAGHAADAAADLLTGFSKGGISWSVKTHVVDFGSVAVNDAIAGAGGTGKAIAAADEAALTAALANIVVGSLGGETCDEVDNDCNGCTDEGFGKGDACSEGVGACMSTGMMVCDGAGATMCSATPGEPTAEACGDAIDSDCDGAPSNGCSVDADGDGVPDAYDNCPDVVNLEQGDQDGDGAGDACDADPDGDEIPTEMGDNCPWTANAGQEDRDEDGVGDACDADDALDDDGDGIADTSDVCPGVPDPEQSDIDGDGEGDACDADIDGDGVANFADTCPEDPRLSCPNPVVDVSGCSCRVGSAEGARNGFFGAILAGLVVFARRGSTRSASRRARTTRR
ncbi:thrombospondin type 3 repeat-containing protein [Polyangium sp. 6x1]|uniref:thrombospondin type 3 repeat-containing protein n=1 Tax=Polyangium sp. 6x1 TaxID=3042689 RepID=UPI00248219A7|nr:thrombospondin type 3 repeat-containing protein [Polyangium sp. 6x1]MDI1450291.1 thrombospondin type 3 repeat-containing protein [Polyangium sp. 6x1]